MKVHRVLATPFPRGVVDLGWGDSIFDGRSNEGMRIRYPPVRDGGLVMRNRDEFLLMRAAYQVGVRQLFDVSDDGLQSLFATLGYMHDLGNDSGMI